MTTTHSFNADISLAFRERFRRVLSRPHWGWTRVVLRTLCVQVLEEFLDVSDERRIILMHRLAKIDPDADLKHHEREYRITIPVNDKEVLSKWIAMSGSWGYEQRVLRGITWTLLNALEALASNKREPFLAFIAEGAITWKDIPELREVFR